MKRNLSLTLAMFVLMFISTAQADYPEVDICVGLSGYQTNPDIDGDIVVFQDDDQDIYWKRFADPNDPNVIAVAGLQTDPAISNGIVVWYDQRDTDKDIYGYDINGDTVLTFTEQDGYTQRYPDISGNSVVYQHKPGSYYNLYSHVIGGSAVVVSTASTHQLNHAVDGTIVVWMELVGSVYQIYWRDIGTSDPADTVSSSAYMQYYPAVSGDLVVWAEDKALGDGMDIYAYDLVKEELDLIAGGSGEQNRPAVSGNIIVWHEKKDGRSDYDIRGFDIATGSFLDIATGFDTNDEYPAISGRRIVWQRNGADIVGAEIPSPTVIQVDTPEAGQMFLAATQIDVTWQLAEGTAPDYVDIDFSDNNGSAWQTVVEDVPFTDLQYTWDPIADVNSINGCQIRVSDASDSLTGGISGVFSIFQCDADLTADLTGDCFVDIADVAELARQWLDCGNLHKLTWCNGQ